MKITLPQSTPVRQFATNTYCEISAIWEKTNIPIKHEKACIHKILRVLNSWTTFSANAHKCKPDSKKYLNYQNMLAEMCDITDGDEDQLKLRMRSSRLPAWERDYEFYLNLKAGIITDIMEGKDLHLAKQQKICEVCSEMHARHQEKEDESASQATLATT